VRFNRAVAKKTRPERAVKTLAAIISSPKASFVLEEVDLPEPEPHEVLVRVSGVGICATDLASRDGLLGAPYPAIFGHEAAGVVERTGEKVKKVAPGDHVVLAPDSDGTCPHCQQGHPMYCERFGELNFQTDPNGRTAQLKDGRRAFLKYFGQSSFAQFALAGEHNTVRVRHDLPLKLLGPLGCGIQTGAGTVINGLKPQPGSSMAVIGAGAVGLAAILGAAVSGCAQIIAIDRHPGKLELAKSIGATHIVNTGETPDVAQTIRQVLPRGVEYIVDCAGVPSLVEVVLQALARRGTLALVAVPPTADRKLELPWFPLLLQGQSVRGFVEGDSVPDLFIPRMIELFQEGRFPFDRMIHTYPFQAINEAIEDQKSGKVVKAVLEL